MRFDVYVMSFCSNIDTKSSNNTYLNRAFVVTSNRNHRKILLFNNIEILNKFKIFKHHGIGNFSSNIDLRKQYILIAEKISEPSSFVNKDISQS